MATYPSPYTFLASVGHGIDPAAVVYEDVDLTDGTWTLYDPTTLVSSVANNGSGWHTVTWNAASASSSLNWSNSYTKNQPRWYKSLTVGGVSITSANLVLLQVVIQVDSTVDDFNQAAVFGIMDTPDTTNPADMNVTGAYTRKSTGSNTYYGVLEYTGVTSATHATPVRSFISQLRGFGAGGSGTYITVDSSDAMVRQGSRNSNRSISGAQHVFAGIGAASNSDAVLQGDRQKFRVRYRVFNLTPGSA